LFKGTNKNPDTNPDITDSLVLSFGYGSGSRSIFPFFTLH